MEKMLLACSALLLLLVAPAAYAQTETFSQYVSGLPTANAPLGAADKLYVLQGGTSKAAPISALNFTAATHQFFNAFNGGFSAAQPVAADISGIGTMATQNATAVVITGGSITGLPAPLSASDAATKAYVDSNITGFRIHNPVVLATAAPLPAYTWSATGGGMLTATANGALTIDGVVVTAATRVLVKNELNSGTACNGTVNAACDGIYNVNQVGTGGTPYILQRTTALNSAGAAENTAAGWSGNDSVSVTAGGTLNANTVWVNTANIATLNQTAFSFFQFSSTGGGVASVSNADGTLTIAPSTGVVVASLNLAKPNFISNAMLVNAAITVNGTVCALGASCSLASSTAPVAADTVKCNNTASPGPALDCLFVVLKNTAGFWVNDTPAAPINFIGSRLMVGDAALNPGVVTLHPCVTSTGDWFTNLQATTSNGPCGFFPFFQMVVENQSNNGVGSGAILAAAQTASCTGNCGSYGLIGWAVSNNTSTTTASWALYLECDQYETSGRTACANIESDSVNFVGGPAIPLPNGGPTNPNISIACGGNYTGAFNCENAIFIVPNTQAFITGILFRTGSIQAGAGPNLDGQLATLAIDMPSLYNISWYNGSSLMTSLWGGTAGKLNIFTSNLGINLDGNAGASCGAGINAGTFRAFGGIVTHC